MLTTAAGLGQESGGMVWITALPAPLQWDLEQDISPLRALFSFLVEWSNPASSTFLTGTQGSEH